MCVGGSLFQNFLLSASMDKTVQLWHASTGDRLRKLEHSDYGETAAKCQCFHNAWSCFCNHTMAKFSAWHLVLPFWLHCSDKSGIQSIECQNLCQCMPGSEGAIMECNECCHGSPCRLQGAPHCRCFQIWWAGEFGWLLITSPMDLTGSKQDDEWRRRLAYLFGRSWLPKECCFTVAQISDILHSWWRLL